MKSIFKLFVVAHVAVFRLTRGRIGSSFMNGHVLLLTTTGNKSGKQRTIPLMQFDDDGKRYVIGSMGGQPKDPAWINNLKKTPEVGVEVRGERYRAQASILAGDERTRIFEKVKAAMTNFAEYEKRAAGIREIPVVLLTPL